MADNQFSVKVPSVYEALLAGEDGYKGGRSFQQDRAMQESAPDVASGNYQGALARLMQSGNLQGAMAVSGLANNNRDFQFRQQEANRAQGNVDRSFNLQERQATEKPQYMQIDGPDGNKQLVKIDPYGKGVTAVTPTGSATVPSNPYAYGKQNENQSKDSGYANRMFRAEGVLRDPKVEEAATSAWETAKGMLPGFAANYATSPEYQKFDQAQRDFVNAVLRRESGAAISQSEFDNAKKQYFPQPGDSKERIAEKRKNRQDAIAGVAGGGGQAYKPPFIFDQSGQMVPTGNQRQGVQSQQSSDPLAQAKEAIARGADPNAVRQRLQQHGIDPSGL